MAAGARPGWRAAAWIVAGAGLLPVAGLLLWAIPYAGDPRRPSTGALPFARHFVHYGVVRGWAAGTPRSGSRLPELVPGDIVLCANPQAVYGRWSHVTIVLPDGRVLAQDLLRGMGTASARSLAWYDELRVLRLGTPASRAIAARAAERFVGTMFNLVAHRDDPRQWSCARAVIAAAAAGGIALGDGRCWVTPDALDPDP